MKPKWKQACLAGVILAVFGSAGCATGPQPFEYHDDRDEKPGSGLFSGEQGGFVIYGKTPENAVANGGRPPEAD